MTNNKTRLLEKFVKNRDFSLKIKLTYDKMTVCLRVRFCA